MIASLLAPDDSPMTAAFMRFLQNGLRWSHSLTSNFASNALSPPWLRALASPEGSAFRGTARAGSRLGPASPVDLHAVRITAALSGRASTANPGSLERDVRGHSGWNPGVPLPGPNHLWSRVSHMTVSGAHRCLTC